MRRLVVLLAVALLVLVGCDPPPLASPGSGGSDVADVVDPSVVGTPQGSFVSEDWHYVGETGEPAFQNGWENISGSPSTAFRIRESGIVDVSFTIQSGITAEVFTLPSGYRPSALTPIIGSSVAFTPPAAPVAVRVSVDTDGVVFLTAFTVGDVAACTGFFFLDTPDLAA